MTKPRADHATRFSAARQPEKTGRPRESRDRLSRRFLEELAADFDKNGAAVIAEVRASDPSTYLRVVASLQPKELELRRPEEDIADDELVALIAQLRAALPPKPDDQHKVH
jgi:hypothetical protein